MFKHRFTGSNLTCNSVVSISKTSYYSFTFFFPKTKDMALGVFFSNFLWPEILNVFKKTSIIVLPLNLNFNVVIFLGKTGLSEQRKKNLFFRGLWESNTKKKEIV